MKILDFNYIKNLNIDPQTLYNWCNEAWLLKEDSILPPKMKMWQGDSGRYITMPCVIPSIDIGGVKFISRNVDDRNGVPARNSNIMIQKCSEMGLLAVMDGIWITNMRTGAIAAHSAIAYCKSNMETLGIMGLGIAAHSFMHFFGNIYKSNVQVKVLRYKNQAEEFINKFEPRFPHLHFEIVDSVEEICGCDTVVSAVSYARDTFVSDDIFKPGCVVVPIHTAGFQNCDLVFDKVIIDDHEHVKAFKYYDTFKSKSIEMDKIEKGIKAGRESDTERIIAYCGGIALHDIYTAYKVYQIALERNDTIDVEMSFPQERLWI